jgi:hypothetical protein
VDPAVSHSSFLRQKNADQLGARIRDALEARHLASVETELLRPLDQDFEREATKPVVPLTDPSGKRYVLKLAEPALVAAEIAAYELRRLGGRPTIPVRRVTVELPGGAVVSGGLKVFLDFDETSQLSNDTVEWSELQRTVMLREHAWDWFLDNLDTNTSQYALLGVAGFPLNIDWDRAFANEARSELSRFTKYRTALPNARTFLYADYVEGRISLDFSFLRHEARRIHRLQDAAVRAVALEYAEVGYGGDPAKAAAFTAAMLERKRNIEKQFEHFIRELRAERRLLAEQRHPTLARRAFGLGRITWNQLQRGLDTIGRSQVGNAARRVVKLVRGRALAARGGAADSGERPSNGPSVTLS